MKILFETSFEKDIRKITDDEIKTLILQTIQNVKSATTLREIKNLKKLHSFKDYYRIKIDNYRIGLELFKDTFIFVRCLNRKEIYRYFP
ncbi:MAG: type II toxin-antitoxin system RelE/ParE family toxin [Ignavibacteriales bacterium]|nr:type II toxin-antitoxin system RelE/ParE family toxin [Ignavibacteriales bacterium]